MATNFTDVELEEQTKVVATQPRTVTLTFDVSESALHLVRAGFNPDHSIPVGNFHIIFAGIITALERIRDRDKPVFDNTNVPMSKQHRAIDDAARHAAMAISESEKACMLAVKAATADLYFAKT